MLGTDARGRLASGPSATPRLPLLLLMTAAASSFVSALFVGYNMRPADGRMLENVPPSGTTECRPHTHIAAERAALLDAASQAMGGAPVTSVCQLETYVGAPKGASTRAADADLMRYARLEFAPQIKHNHFELVAESLSRRHDAQLIMWGTGVDSPVWRELTRCGRVVFVEENRAWANRVCSWLPDAEVVVYDEQARGGYTTHLANFMDDAALMRSDPRCDAAARARGIEAVRECPLLMVGLGDEILSHTWDALVVDGPVGWGDPGRSMSAFTAAALAQAAHSMGRVVDVFVHDCERQAERAFVEALWGGAYTIVDAQGPEGPLPERQMCHVRLA